MIDEPTDYETRIARCKAAERLGGYAEAAKFAVEAEAIAAAQGRTDAQAAALRLLANQLSRTGAHEEAARACERAVKLFEAAGAEAELPETLTDLTLIYVMLGLHEEALEAVTRSLAIAQKLNDTRLLYWAHNRTGVVRNSMGDVKAADAVMRTALTLAEKLGPAEQYCILNNLADNAHELVLQCRETGNTVLAETALAQGLEFAEAALALAADGTRPYQEALALGNYGFLLALNGNFDAASAALDRAAEITSAQGYASLAVTTAHFAGRVALLRGDSDAGIESLRRVIEQAAANGEKRIVANLNRQLSEAYASLGDAARALAHFKTFYTLELEINNNVAQTRARLLSNMVELEKSRIEAERSRMEAEALRAQRAGLEAEKQALQAKADELGRVAHEDALTGLWNRRYIDTVLEPLFERMTRTSRPPCVALCDIDHFKSINDSFGHAAGDAVLTKVAALLLRGARQSDIVARFGGEEFLIIFAESDLPAATLACQRLRTAIAGASWDVPGLLVTISIGVVPADASASLPSTVQAADKMLYRAKQNGRNRVEFGAG